MEKDRNYLEEGHLENNGDMSNTFGVKLRTLNKNNDDRIDITYRRKSSVTSDTGRIQKRRRRVLCEPQNCELVAKF